MVGQRVLMVAHACEAAVDARHQRGVARVLPAQHCPKGSEAQPEHIGLLDGAGAGVFVPCARLYLGGDEVVEVVQHVKDRICQQSAQRNSVASANAQEERGYP